MGRPGPAAGDMFSEQHKRGEAPSLYIFGTEAARRQRHGPGIKILLETSAAEIARCRSQGV